MDAYKVLKMAKDKDNKDYYVVDLYLTENREECSDCEYYLIKIERPDKVKYISVVRKSQTIETGHGSREGITYTARVVGEVPYMK